MCCQTYLFTILGCFYLFSFINLSVSCHVLSTERSRLGDARPPVLIWENVNNFQLSFSTTRNGLFQNFNGLFHQKRSAMLLVSIHTHLNYF